MQSNLCPVCKGKFSTKKISEENSIIPNLLNKNLKHKEDVRPIRTSTPVATFENIPTVSSSDSVTDFFYQSWKSGLHSNDSQTCQRSSEHWNQPPYTSLTPFCYAPHIVYVNTVIFQPYMPVQHVGYRSDGTFGVLPMYWPFNSN